MKNKLLTYLSSLANFHFFIFETIKKDFLKDQVLSQLRYTLSFLPKALVKKILPEKIDLIFTSFPSILNLKEILFDLKNAEEEFSTALGSSSEKLGEAKDTFPCLEFAAEEKLNALH